MSAANKTKPRRQARPHRVEARFSTDELASLDEAVTQRGTSRSDVIRDASSKTLAALSRSFDRAMRRRAADQALVEHVEQRSTDALAATTELTRQVRLLGMQVRALWLARNDGAQVEDQVVEQLMVRVDELTRESQRIQAEVLHTGRRLPWRQ